MLILAAGGMIPYLSSVAHSWPAYLRATSMNVAVLMGVDKPDWALAQSQPSPNWNFFVGLSIACRRSRHPTPHMRSTKGKGHKTPVTEIICPLFTASAKGEWSPPPPVRWWLFWGKKRPFQAKKYALAMAGGRGGGLLANKFCNWDF